MVNLKEYYKFETDKINKAAEYSGAAGGKLALPAVGEVITVKIVGEPTIIKNEKMINGEGVIAKVEMNGIDFDMQITRTIAFGLEKEMKKYNLSGILGKTFKIMAKAWDSEEYGKSKTYSVIYQKKPFDLKEEEAEEAIETVDM